MVRTKVNKGQFLNTALLLNEIYPSMMFHSDASYTFRVMGISIFAYGPLEAFDICHFNDVG